jgi:hypothetical protein
MKYVFMAIAFATLVAFISCAKKTTATAAVKPTSYTTDVLPLLQVKCSPCHIPSKGGNKANFENYASASKFGVAMVSRVMLNPGERGFMPMRGQKIPENEIALLKKWVDGGMVEN